MGDFGLVGGFGLMGGFGLNGSFSEFGVGLSIVFGSGGIL